MNNDVRSSQSAALNSFVCAACNLSYGGRKLESRYLLEPGTHLDFLGGGAETFFSE